MNMRPPAEFHKQEMIMRNLNQAEIFDVSGGEIVQGFPTPDMLCLNMKLMIEAGRGEAGFDITAAAKSLVKYCVNDFWDPNVAHEYVINGNIPVPNPNP
jgi:hypothetical protein